MKAPQSTKSLIVGLLAGALVTSSAIWAHADSQVLGDQLCRTKAGYLRLSATGECRRSETPIELPQGPQGEEGPQGEPGQGVDLSLIGELQDQNSTLSAELADLKTRVGQVPLNSTFASGMFFYPGMDITGVDISGRNLSGVNLAGLISNGNKECMASVDLSTAILSKAKLRGCWSDINFRDAQLDGADLQTSRFSGSNFHEASLDSADLTAALVFSSDFSGARLSGAKLKKASLCTVDFSGADLRNADMSDAMMNPWDVPYWESNYCESGLNGERVTFSGADLRGATLSNTTWLFVDLTGADLTGADLTGADLREVNIQGADLTDATLNGIHCEGIEGTPRALPAGWSLVDGRLIGPSPN